DHEGRITNRRNTRPLTFPDRSGPAGRDHDSAFDPARVARWYFRGGLHAAEGDQGCCDTGKRSVNHSYLYIHAFRGWSDKQNNVIRTAANRTRLLGRLTRLIQQTLDRIQLAATRRRDACRSSA